MRLLSFTLALYLSLSAFVSPIEGECTHLDADAQEIASAPCAASEASCHVWQQFRGAHPFPYQTIAVSVAPNGDTAVILSEPPPIAPPEEITALVEAVFDGYSPKIDRLRFPVGHDGWLEDIVLYVENDEEATISIPTASGETITLASGLANRLQYLHQVLFGSAEDFYVDQINKPNVVTRITLPDLKVTAADLQSIIRDKNRKWLALASPDSAPVSWAEAQMKTKASSFIGDSADVVVLLIPPNSEVTSIRGEFRRFAVTTDYIVGALRPKRGGLALFGRNRLIPLDVLPPLRFETVASLARTLGTPLGQSYERQRVLAGKIGSGEHAEWDWAPIYLSPQLQDSEFGTLLNLADQQLKSWSERGEVRYANFSYPDPERFPFGETTATDWFMEHALSTSLIFNWNTRAFSTAVDDTVGRIISASSTTALPMSYIIPVEEELEFLTMLRESREIDPSARSIEASNTGTKYFASLGDPLLARVVQNTFLYQILSEAQPFRRTATSPVNETKRSTAVTKILIDETSRWMTEATEPRPEGNAELAKLVRQSGMTIPKLAELLAAPELNTRTIVRARSSAELAAETLRRLFIDGEAQQTELKDIYEKRFAEFKGRCRELGGTTETVKDGTICKYQSATGQPATFPTSYDARYNALVAELTSLDQQAQNAEATLSKAGETLERLAKERETADRVADDLRLRASFAADLDRVLASVLQATSATASDSFIQTPSVVLSCNAADKSSVGGHNIDALPWLVKQGSMKAAPVVGTIGDRPTLVVPKEQLGRSTELARRMIERSRETPLPPDRPLHEALGLSTERKSGSFLEQLRNRTELLSGGDAEVMTRARECKCDLYVERGAGDTTMIVSLGPPPRAESVFGSSRLVEKLQEEAKPSGRVLFAGFSKEQVSALTRNAVRQPGEAKQAGRFLEDAIGRTKDFFRNAVDPAANVLRLPMKPGKSAIVALSQDTVAARGRLAEMLEQRPGWRNAEVIDGIGKGSPPLFEVVFPKEGKKGTDLESISVHVYGEKRNVVTGTDLITRAKTTVGGLSKTDPVVADAINRLAEQLERDSRVKEVEFFLKDVDSVRIVRMRRNYMTHTFEVELGK